MNKAFSTHLTRVQIRSIFNTKKFGERTTCPNCNYKHEFWKLDDQRWQCTRCDKKFGILTDTALAHTRFSLPEIYELLHWFELELTDNKVADRLNVSYHRVHHFFMTVRKAIQDYEEESITLLDGIVEVDETYCGAEFQNRRKKERERLRKQGKVRRGRGANELQQAVFGIYERADGIVYVEPVDDVSKPTLQDIIRGKVSIETTICSDTFGSYNGLDEEFEDHQTINHDEDEYRDGDAYINGIEGFWAYAKERLLRYHGVSPDNFLSYLKEIEFRFNHRDLDSDGFVDKLLEVLL